MRSYVHYLVIAAAVFFYQSSPLSAQILMRQLPPGATAAASSRPEPEQCLPTLEEEDKKLAKAQREANGGAPGGELVVYGRPGCGITQKYMKEFKQVGIAFTFKDIDNPAIDKEFTEKVFEAGMGGSVNLPVIENDGTLTQRPNLAALIKERAPNAVPQKENQGAAPEKAKDGNGPIVIYGRMGCSVTKRYTTELQQAGVPYTFCDIDTPAGGKEFNEKLSQAGFSGSIDLPVVNNNGNIAIRPKLASLIKGVKPEDKNASKPGKPQSLSDNQKNPIIIYSVKSCGNTKRYMEELNELNMPYVFKDVDNPTIHKEFSQKLIAAGHSGSINLPAVIIDGKVFIKPTLAATMQAKKQ